MSDRLTLSLRSSLRALTCAIAAIAALNLAPPTASAAPAPPPAYPAGFYTQTIRTPLSSSPFELNNIAYLPPVPGAAGGYLGAGKSGKIVWVPEAGGGSVLATVPAVRTQHDAGMLAATPAADFRRSGRFYILYPKLFPGAGSYAMVERWVVNSPVAPTSARLETVVVDGREINGSVGGLTTNTLSHMTGDVLTDSDGTIYFSNGDDASFNFADPNAFRSLDPKDPHGKVFRILPDGSGVPGNPFYDAANPRSWASRVYSYGLRNPYRLWKDPATGAIMGADVGWNNAESILIHRPGTNHGWPCWEGSQIHPGYAALPEYSSVCLTPDGAQIPRTPALFTYPHNRRQASATGGAVYTGSTYPAAYRGATFFGDYALGQLFTLRTDGTSLTAPGQSFATNVGTPTAMRSGPGGDIVWADIATSSIVRLRWASVNHAPVALFTQTVDAARRTITYDARASYDPERTSLEYRWNFGDGTGGSGPVVSHRYRKPGRYTAYLQVIDRDRRQGFATQTALPAHSAPTMLISGITPGKRYAPGELISLSARSSSGRSVKWTAVVRHCPYNGPCHSHAHALVYGPVFRTLFTSHGDNAHLLLTAVSPPDRAGVSTTRTYTFAPG